MIPTIIRPIGLRPFGETRPSAHGKASTLCFSAVLAGSLLVASQAWAQSEGGDKSNVFAGPYVGLDLGLKFTSASLDTDLGGSGDGGANFDYQLYGGYNLVRGRLVVGVEGQIGMSGGKDSIASNDADFQVPPMSYFKQRLFFGGDVRFGALVGSQNSVLVYGSVGVQSTATKLWLGGIPLSQFADGVKSSTRYSALRLGGGIEWPISDTMTWRFRGYRVSRGKLGASDFNAQTSDFGVSSVSIKLTDFRILTGLSYYF